jgi:hypothetical protein
VDALIYGHCRQEVRRGKFYLEEGMGQQKTELVRMLPFQDPSRLWTF